MTKATEHPGYQKRLRLELLEFAILAAYLFICFTALAGFKAVLRAHGMSLAPSVFEAVIR